MIQNNYGWSLKEMIFLSGILLFFVLLVAFLINQLYSGFAPVEDSKKENGYTYQQVETNLADAGKRFFTNHKNEVNNLITSDMLLKENYISSKTLMVNEDTCEGYVLIENSKFIPYIKCNHYVTEGY